MRHKFQGPVVRDTKMFRSLAGQGRLKHSDRRQPCPPKENFHAGNPSIYVLGEVVDDCEAFDPNECLLSWAVFKTQDCMAYHEPPTPQTPNIFWRHVTVTVTKIVRATSGLYPTRRGFAVK